MERFEEKDEWMMETGVYLLNGKEDEKWIEDGSGWLKWGKRMEGKDLDGGEM